MATVSIDAGHGGMDSGAVYNGRQEKDDVLRLAMAVGDILEKNGVNVSYVRTDDTYETPFKKAQDANASGADLLVSIHRNSGVNPNTYSGVQSLVFRNNGIRREVADNINENLEELGFRNLGIEERPNLVVLRRSSMPAVLLEVGFINNEEDNQLFDSKFNEIAQGIADGILETLYEDHLEGEAVNATPAQMQWNESQENQFQGSQSRWDQSQETQFQQSQPQGNLAWEEQKMYVDGAYEERMQDGDMRDMYNAHNFNDVQDSTQTENVQNSEWNSTQMRNMQNGEMIRNMQDGMAERSAQRRFDNDMLRDGDMVQNDNMMPDGGMLRNNNMMPDSGMLRNNMMPDDGMQRNNNMNLDGNMMRNNNMSNNNMSLNRGSGCNCQNKLYRVQVGAYRNRESADKILNSLLVEGFPAFIVYDDGLFKIQVGAYEFLGNAIAMEERLRRYRYNTYITT